MSGKTSPDWLVALQDSLGAYLQTPLDSARVDDGVSASALAELARGESRTAVAGLEVYRAQYWLRLLNAVRNEWPLTAAILGASAFRARSQEFLLSSPPNGFDIAEAATGFDRYLQNADVISGAMEIVREALAVDAAWREIARARCEPIFRPSTADGEWLLRRRLVPRSGWSVIEEHWPLVETRRLLAVQGIDTPVPRLSSLAVPSYWLLFRTGQGAGQLPIPKSYARLLTLLCDHPIRVALALLEAEVTAGDRESLALRVRGILAQSVELGLWTGLSE